jgi:hypothetical protein
MGLVPGYKHDLFLSYSHAETAWFEAFRKALCQEFQERVGKPVSFWQDSRNLRLGQKWTGEIESAIQQAAAFLAIVSPSYHNSDWCRDERRILLEYNHGLEGLKVQSFYRFLKIIKAPGPDKAHEKLFRDVQHVKFFNENDGYELPLDSREFASTIRDTVRAIRELLQLMSNTKRKLYVAPGPLEMEEDRKNLRNQLSDDGFDVRPGIPLSADYGLDPVWEEMEPASFAIFLLGGAYDPFIADQFAIAKELNKPMIFWAHPGKSRNADKSQANLLSRIRDGQDLPPGSHMLGGASIRVMLEQFRSVLEGREEPATPGPRPDAGIAKVYLLYDTTMPGESQIANRLCDMVRARKLEVFQSGQDGNHEQLMRTSNAVLLLRAANPDPDWWLKFNVRELDYAREMYQRDPDFVAKAALVAEPARVQGEARNTPVFSYREPFSPETLDPFFDKLRQPGLDHRSADARG